MSGAHRGQQQLRRRVWLLPAAFALHELEEWNIVPWFRGNFTPQTKLTDWGARTLLVASASHDCDQRDQRKQVRERRRTSERLGSPEQLAA